MFTEVLEAIKAYNTIILHRHGRPDGDALGSQIGLKAILQENFPDKEIYMVGDGAHFYSFMEGAVMDEIPDAYFDDALSIILDCGDEGLISDERFKLAKRTARIDHHLFTHKFADVEVIDSSFESCCGLIAQFAKESGMSLLESAAILLNVAGHIWIVFVLLSALSAVFSLLGALFIKKESLLKKKRKQRAVKKAATAIRETVLAPLIVFVAVQTALCITLLLFTPIAMHLDFSNVSDTLSVVYLTVANIRTLGTTNTLYALFAVCGLLLWHAADGAVTALIVQADKQRSA